MNETFWDAQNVEIGACAIFDYFSGSGKNSRSGSFFVDWMLGEADGHGQAGTDTHIRVLFSAVAKDLYQG